MNERVYASQTIYDGRVVRLRLDTVVLADGHEVMREIVEHAQAVAIVPVDADGRVVMVRQFRLAVGRVMLEVPAGMIDPDEAVEVAAQRELQEETGFRAERLTRLGGFYVAPGYCTEYIHLYLAEGLSESRLDADDDERIEVEAIPLDDLLARIGSGEIDDAKSMCGLLLYARARS